MAFHRTMVTTAMWLWIGASAGCQAPATSDDPSTSEPENTTLPAANGPGDAASDSTSTAPTTSDAGAGAVDGDTLSLGPHVYAVFEQDFAAPGRGYANPWEDVAVSMTVTSATGRSTTLGGFYHSPNVYK